MSKFTILRNRLLKYLSANNMKRAIEALEFAEGYHTGLRRNGDPEFSHQLEMAVMIIALPSVAELENTLVTCFLHDIREDYGVEDHIIRLRFGSLNADAVDLLTKEFRGVKRNIDDPFSIISSNQIAALVKGIDRNHNLQTMDGAFSPTKQDSYRMETVHDILPMLRHAHMHHLGIRRALDQIIGRLTVLSGLPKPAHT